MDGISLVLDCLVPDDFSSSSHEWTNLQNHVIKEKKISEKAALSLFYEILKIVVRLHGPPYNIVHRDLKLGNLAYNRRTREIVILNFCLGKQLSSDRTLLQDQRGSPAYISPEVLSGKSSDMWAL